MSEDKTVNEETTETERDPLTPETFSFIDVLEGREYPKDIVEVYMDERAGYEKRALLVKLAQLDPERDAETIEIFLNDLDDIQARIDASIYEFHITGVDDELITDAAEIASAHFEGDKKPRKMANGDLVKRLPEDKQSDYLRYYNALVLSLHVEKIVHPSGAVMVAPDPEEIARFLDKGPTLEKAKLQEKIQSLRVESSVFEQQVDADFLARL